MKKNDLIKYIEGRSTTQEAREVLQWVEKDVRNKEYFIQLKNTWVLSHISNDEASETEMKDAESIMNLYPKAEASRPRFGLSAFGKAAAACALLLLVGNIYLLTVKSPFESSSSVTDVPERVLLSSLPNEYKHTIYTNKGVKGVVELPDGSTVWLNSDTKITFPDRFDGDTREVEMSGEAFFDVVKDSLRPMIVSTNKDFQVKVLGTKFNIKSYDEDNKASASLISGKIAILKKNSKDLDVVVANLEEKESYVVSSGKHTQERGKVVSVDTEKQTAWKNGILIFESTPVSEVIKELERWYGTKFTVMDQNVYDNKFTAEFKSESIVQIMEMLKYCSLIDYTIKDNQVWLRSK